MATVSEILSGKSGAVIEIDGEATVFDAVKAMVAANVGAILVTAGGEIEGIFTERDYLRRIAVEGRRSRDTLVREVMSAPVIVLTPETTVDEGMALMSDRRIRHAPVVEDGARRRNDLDRRPGQVHVEAAELPDPVPERVHHRPVAATAKPVRGPLVVRARAHRPRRPRCRRPFRSSQAPSRSRSRALPWPACRRRLGELRHTPTGPP